MLDADFYLFIYDIHKPKTMRQLTKRLDLENSMRIQKSVFEVQGDDKAIIKLIEDVNNIIDIATDKIAIIPLCKDDYEKVEFYGVLSKQPKIFMPYLIL